MIYEVMKKLIDNEKFKLRNNLITSESFTSWKTQTLKKLDLYKRCSRLTEQEYSELIAACDK